MNGNGNNNITDRGISAILNGPRKAAGSESAAQKRAAAVGAIVEALEGYNGVEMRNVLEAALLCLQDPAEPQSIQDAIDFLRARGQERARREAAQSATPARRWWRW